MTETSERRPGAAGRRGRDAGDRAAGRAAQIDPVLVVAVVVAALLRAWALGSQSLWYDEWLTARAAGGGIGDLYRYVTEQAGIPPTFFVIEWLWAQPFGTSEASLRFLPLLAGVATVPVAAWAASTWDANRAGVRLVAVLAATNPMLVWYSQEARPYSFVALLTAATMIPLRRWVVHGRRSDLGWWAALATLTAAFHYYAIFVVVLQGLYLTARRRPRSRDLPAVVPAAVVAGALLPFAVVQLGRRENHGWIAEWDLALRLREMRSSALTGPGVAGGPLLGLGTVAALVLLGAMIWAGRARGTRGLLVLAGFGLGAVVAGWATALAGVDGFLSRYFIGAVVALLVSAGAAGRTARAARLAGVAVAVLAVVGVAGVVTVQREPHAQRDDWRAVAEAFEDGGGDGPAALVVDLEATTAGPLTWYLPDRRVVTAEDPAPVTDLYLLTLGHDDAPCNWLVGRPCGFLFVGIPPQGDLAEAFTEVERIPAGPFVLVRYRSADQVEVGPEDFGGVDRSDVPLVVA